MAHETVRLQPTVRLLNSVHKLEQNTAVYTSITFEEIVIAMVSNSNWTEWSPIQGVTAQVISKSDEREVRGRFEITSTITP